MLSSFTHISIAFWAESFSMNKQDHHASSKASQGMANPCPLWGVLLRKFAIGKISAAELQEISSAAVKSGANSQEMLGLQSLGTMGQVKGNCHRDLCRKHFGALLSPQPWKIPCLLQQKEEGQQTSKISDCWLLLPHMWTVALEENDLLPALTCQDEELVVFWKSQKSSPQMTSALWKELDFKHPSRLPIPWLLHGDSAPYTEADSLQVVSMRPCALKLSRLGTPAFVWKLALGSTVTWAG